MLPQQEQSVTIAMAVWATRSLMPMHYGFDRSITTANAYADGERFIHANARSESGESGDTIANATALQHGNVEIDPLAEANAFTGDFGSAIANAHANGNWLTRANAIAQSGLSGYSEAISDAESLINLSQSFARAETGDWGTAITNATALSHFRNLGANAQAVSNAGFAGTALAFSDAATTNGFHQHALSRASATTGDFGLSQATANADANVDWGNPYAQSIASAVTGTDGTADASTNAVSNGGTDALAESTATHGITGRADANASVNALVNAQADATAQGVIDTNTGAGPQLASASVDTLTGATPGAAPVLPGPTQNVIQQTQDNELVVHNQSVVLMGNDGAQTTLSGRLADATSRSVANPLGGETYVANDIRNAIFANHSGTSTIVDTDGGFGALNQLALLSTGTTQVLPDVVLAANNHLSVLTHGDLINQGFIKTQSYWRSTIGLSALGRIDLIGGEIATRSPLAGRGFLPVDGGSIVIKAGETLTNAINVQANGTPLWGPSVHLGRQPDTGRYAELGYLAS